MPRAKRATPAAGAESRGRGSWVSGKIERKAREGEGSLCRWSGKGKGVGREHRGAPGTTGLCSGREKECMCCDKPCSQQSNAPPTQRDHAEGTQQQGCLREENKQSKSTGEKRIVRVGGKRVMSQGSRKKYRFARRWSATSQGN